MPNYPQRCIYDKYQGKWYLTEERKGVIIQRSSLREQFLNKRGKHSFPKECLPQYYCPQ
ncbi:MAG: hypothetical protein F6J98_16320 [Moorea sp. SIO4G2]|nr:hypothetical protein [Moorena sp. SIO4G2]